MATGINQNNELTEWPVPETLIRHSIPELKDVPADKSVKKMEMPPPLPESPESRFSQNLVFRPGKKVES